MKTKNEPLSDGTRATSGRTAQDYTIIVAYDGERTEDDYFRGWKLIIPPSRLSLEHFYVKSGGDVYKAVEACIKKKAKLKNFAEFWCVCDVDDTSDEALLAARNLALANNIRLCTSSRCFEVWILLHHKFSDAAIDCEDDAISRVREYYCDYGSPYKVAPFYKLFPKTENAITNATQLSQQQCKNPATTMHHLARKLLQNCV